MSTSTRRVYCKPCNEHQATTQWGRCMVCSEIIAEPVRHNYWRHLLIWWAVRSIPFLLIVGATTWVWLQPPETWIADKSNLFYVSLAVLTGLMLLGIMSDNERSQRRGY